MSTVFQYHGEEKSYFRRKVKEKHDRTEKDWKPKGAAAANTNMRLVHPVKAQIIQADSRPLIESEDGSELLTA